MSRAFNVDEKYKQLKMRKDEHRKLGQHIDNIIRQSDSANQPRGCFPGICSLLARWRGHRPAMRAVEIAAAVSSSTGDTEFQRAVFGLAGVKKGDPAAKLEEAASVMRGRIVALEERAQEQRGQALSLQKLGQKAQAIRALKKAKAIEAQVASNQAALDAVEQQVDMLAQAAMQKTMTAALASTSKTMKADAKMLGKAEKAIDDATDARDMANDLNQVVTEFAANGAADVDDDDLEAELMAMLDTEPPPPPAAQQMADDGSTSAAASEAERQQEIARLESRIAQYEEARAVRDMMPAAPSAPTNGKAKMKEEKAGLLSSM